MASKCQLSYIATWSQIKAKYVVIMLRIIIEISELVMSQNTHVGVCSSTGAQESQVPMFSPQRTCLGPVHATGVLFKTVHFFMCLA